LNYKKNKRLKKQLKSAGSTLKLSYFVLLQERKKNIIAKKQKKINSSACPAITKRDLY